MAHRSLADDLRARGDDDLAALLTARPDLTVPAAADLPEIARRAGALVSVRRALSQLDRPTLAVAHACAVLATPFSLDGIAAACAAKATEIAPFAGTLHTLGLIWGDPQGWRPVRTLGAALGSHPAGLGPSIRDLGVTAHPAALAAAVRLLGAEPTGDPAGDLDRWQDAVRDLWDVDGRSHLPPEAVDLLTQLEDHGPIAAVDHLRAEFGGGVDWLLDRLLLVPQGPDLVTAPREVGRAVRGSVVRLPRQPTLPAARVSPAQDEAGAAAALTFLRQTEDLCRLLDAGPPPRLRLGGIGVRETSRLARELMLTTAELALLLEVVGAADLIAADDGVDPVYRPTELFDSWSEASPGHRWVQLVTAWLTRAGSPQLAGTRDDRGVVRAPLSPATQHGSHQRLRVALLDLLAKAPADRAWQVHDVDEHLRWARPLGALREPGSSAADTLGQARTLGLVADGATTAARQLLTDPEAAARTMDAAMPAIVEQVVIQADLTAIAPGPLGREARELLDQVADVESQGAATVYRFTQHSVHRALDEGWDAAGLLTRLEELSTTGVPQPLEYLIRDGARRHGLMRVGAASAYLRHDDDVVLTEVLFDPQLLALHLSRIAPTVLISPVDPITVLAVLRRAGYAPAAEHPDGRVVVPQGRPARSAAPTRIGEPRPNNEVENRALVRALRRAPSSTGRPSPPASLPPDDPATALAKIDAAIRDGAAVWLAGTDALGARSIRLVEPVSREPGRIRVLDPAGRMDVVPLHRISGVARAEPVG